MIAPPAPSGTIRGALCAIVRRADGDAVLAPTGRFRSIDPLGEEVVVAVPQTEVVPHDDHAPRAVRDQLRLGLIAGGRGNSQARAVDVSTRLDMIAVDIPVGSVAIIHPDDDRPFASVRYDLLAVLVVGLAAYERAVSHPLRPRRRGAEKNAQERKHRQQTVALNHASTSRLNY